VPGGGEAERLEVRRDVEGKDLTIAPGADLVHSGYGAVVRPVQRFRRLLPGARAECGGHDRAVREHEDASGVDQYSLDRSHERRIGAGTTGG
jgi:hypothetical protein